jgi:ATP-dependent Lon protease
MDTKTQRMIVPADSILPNRVVLVPLLGKPIFPGIFTPLMVTGKADVAAIEEAITMDGLIGLVLTRNEDAEIEPEREFSIDDFYRIGTTAKIVKRINLPDGGYNIFISTLKRFRVKKLLKPAVPMIAAVDHLEDENDGTDEVKALTRSLISEMKQISENNNLFSEEMRLNMVNIDHPGKIADFITSILNIDREEQQKVLELTDVYQRMEQVLLHIKREQELLRIQKKIQKQINEKIEQSQREYFLKEELKAIKQELGMPTDSKSSEYNRLSEAIEKLDLSTDTREPIENELEKFKLMDPNSSEFHVTRNYLDTIVSLPWGEPPGAAIDIEQARSILDKDHYGLEDVKERILEYLAVRKLKADFKGSIICLVGPPGVGKTSVGRSVARALGKKFFRFSVGGMRDEAEIKGHRRTYVGAMPGKIIQGLKIVKTSDPVFMIDEIDKLGASYQGDPSSALLEVLDPEQNVAFRDHYLDLPFDISNILFIATANSLDTVPLALQDRMEVIRLAGYIDDEKVAIARKYLIPRSIERAGLKRSDMKYTAGALVAIANQYAREAGMRNYEQALDKIHRKLARRVVTGSGAAPFRIDTNDLEEYLGKPLFTEDLIRKVTQPGMSIGLAWTPFGGDVLIVEAITNPGAGGFKITGQMGEVMQESASIAYTYARHATAELGIDADWWETRHIHLHIPAGAIRKDGPSAGITMATALISLATGRSIRPRIGMTGELSLSGRVLPIGGLKEKTVAARRHKLKAIIIPDQNQRDLEEIPEKVRKGITFHPVETMDQVLEIILR